MVRTCVYAFRGAMKMVITLLAKLKASKPFYKRFTDFCNNLCVLEKILTTGHSKETNLPM